MLVGKDGRSTNEQTCPVVISFDIHYFCYKYRGYHEEYSCLKNFISTLLQSVSGLIFLLGKNFETGLLHKFNISLKVQIIFSLLKVAIVCMAQLTQWSRVISELLMVAHLRKTFSASHGTY